MVQFAETIFLVAYCPRTFRSGTAHEHLCTILAHKQKNFIEISSKMHTNQSGKISIFGQKLDLPETLQKYSF